MDASARTCPLFRRALPVEASELGQAGVLKSRIGGRFGVRFSQQTPAFMLKESGTDARNPLKNRQLDVLEVPPDSAGINGTPMPESGDALTPDQVWQIVHYVQALGAWKGSSHELREFAAELPPPVAVSP